MTLSEKTYAHTGKHAHETLTFIRVQFKPLQFELTFVIKQL